MNYQPIFGVPDAPYQRDCEERYEILRETAARFNRRFSVLDLGANFGWFDFKLMSEFDCTCVLVDNKPVRALIDEFGKDRAYHLNRHLTGREISKLAKSENFDIVLGLAVLHHIHDFRAAFEGIKKLGKHVFIELPAETSAANPSKHDEISEMLDGHREIAMVKSHLGGMRPLYLLEGELGIEEQSLDAQHRKAPSYGTYALESDFDRCEITIKRPNPNLNEGAQYEKRDFHPGMNAHNFMLLGGGYPNKETLVHEMAQFSHPDPYPWNFVLGHGVIPIDTEKKF